MKRSLPLVVAMILLLALYLNPLAIRADVAKQATIDTSQCTGIVIDASGLDNPALTRSPAATVSTFEALVYPDRSHVPTPDQVQDESIVRYYRSMDAAKAGVGGDHPLIIRALKVVGPAHDGVIISDADAAAMKAVDDRIHVLDTWKLGMVIRADQ